MAWNCQRGWSATRRSPPLHTGSSPWSLSNAGSARRSAIRCAAILLSSLEGAAVTSIKIAGAGHEFTSIRGVLEDVTDIVLNVKTLIVKSHSEEPKTIRVHSEVKGPVTAPA